MFMKRIEKHWTCTATLINIETEHYFFINMYCIDWLFGVHMLLPIALLSLKVTVTLFSSVRWMFSLVTSYSLLVTSY